MKSTNLILLITLASVTSYAQSQQPADRLQREISALIDQYSLARETRDTVLLKNILTDDIDQLVSTGEWRSGIHVAVQGMLASSANAPGKRMLTVDKIKVLSSNCAIADCRYEITTANGDVRSMWSTFFVVYDNGKWKISAIRNMLPSKQ